MGTPEAPSPRQIDRLVSTIGIAPYVFAGGCLPQTDDSSGLDVTVVALAHAVSRSADVAVRIGDVDDITIEVAGHVIRRGSGHFDLAANDTTRSRVSSCPLATIRLHNDTITTSAPRHIGALRRRTTIDPRSVHPITGAASGAAISSNTTTAAVVAQILAVLDTDEAAAFVDRCNAGGGVDKALGRLISITLEPHATAEAGIRTRSRTSNQVVTSWADGERCSTQWS